MHNLLTRMRAAALLGLAWAVVWAPLAVVVGTTIVDPDNSMDEMWVAVGAYAGFLCAVIFSVLLGIAERGRSLGELSLGRACVWGAASGVLVSVLPTVVGASNVALPLWQWVTAMVGPIAASSAVSAVGSVLIAKRSHRTQRSAPASRSS